MGTRRHFLKLVVLGIGGFPGNLPGQAKGRVWRIGILAPGTRPAAPDMDFYGGLIEGLQELGYQEGKNLAFEWRFASGNYETLPELAASLVSARVDLIVTDGAPATLVAQKATKTIPILFGAAADPVANGIVTSLARPGGNTTGISLFPMESKQLEMLLQVVPKLNRLAVLYNGRNQYHALAFPKTLDLARKLGLETTAFDVRTDEDLERLFPILVQTKTDAFLWFRDPFLNSQRGRIANLGLKYRLPGIGGARTYAEAGGLFSYAQNGRDNYVKAATYADKILRGAAPGELPVQQPIKIELVLNLKTAKALGLAFPPELLLLADRVIE